MIPKEQFPTLSEAEERNLDAAVKEGMAYGIMVGAAETYFGAFGIFLQATAVQIGLLSALPPFFGAVCQLLSLRVSKFIHSRRYLIVLGATLQAASIAPLIVLPFFPRGSALAAPLLISLVLLYWGSVGVTVPLWNSLIGDLVPAELRGRYFGYRNQKIGLYTFFSVLMCGAVLDLFQHRALTGFGFAVIFTVAMIARFRSAHWLRRYDDPPYHANPDAYFSFWQFLGRARYSNFTRFVFFASSILGAAAFSAPYFAVYMLRDLHFPYLEFTIVMASQTIAQIYALRNWGRLVDTFGSKKILQFCSYGVVIVPVLWNFSANVFYLMMVQTFSGIVWAGFNLGTSTFMFDAVTPPKRARCAAYQALVQGAFVLCGSLLGGYAIEHLPNALPVLFVTWTPRSPILFIFTLSGLFRLIAILVFLKRFREVRDVKPTRSLRLIFHFLPIENMQEGSLLLSAVSGLRRRKQESADTERTERGIKEQAIRKASQLSDQTPSDKDKLH